MKSLFLSVFTLIFYSFSWSQYNSPWTYSLPNTAQSGYVGVGTKSTSTTTNTPLPNFNLHLHGTTDYIYNDAPSGFQQVDENGKPIQNSSQEKTITNYGKTTRIGMTNTLTGMTEVDGTVLRMSDYDFFIQNRESGYLQIAANNFTFSLSPVGRAHLAAPSTSTIASTDVKYGRLNVWASLDNGLYIKTDNMGKYGVSIDGADNSNAFQCKISSQTTPRFLVKTNGYTEINSQSTLASDKLFLIKNTTKSLLQLTNDGILRSREILVDALTWADYVFEPNYNLMPLNEVKTYISQNGHLPNVPSTAEVNESGVNVAKTDAILLEKIEELTLYLLQQDEKMKALQAEIDALKKEK